MENGLIEYANGDKYWYLNGKLHRVDGPAIEYAGGDKIWYLNGKRHRVDGPAVERFSGYKEWYLDDDLLDYYYPNFGCFTPKTREEALKRLNSKPRPYSYELYMADINKLFPEVYFIPLEMSHKDFEKLCQLKSYKV